MAQTQLLSNPIVHTQWVGQGFCTPGSLTTAVENNTSPREEALEGSISLNTVCTALLPISSQGSSLSTGNSGFRRDRLPS